MMSLHKEEILTQTFTQREHHVKAAEIRPSTDRGEKAQEDSVLPAPWSSSLQICERMYLCCSFPRLWYFVTAAIATSTLLYCIVISFCTMWALGEVTAEVGKAGISWRSKLKESQYLSSSLQTPGPNCCQITQVPQATLCCPFSKCLLTIEWSLCSLESSSWCYMSVYPYILKALWKPLSPTLLIKGLETNIGPLSWVCSWKPIWDSYYNILYKGPHSYAPLPCFGRRKIW